MSSVHVPHSMWIMPESSGPVTASSSSWHYNGINTFDDWHLVPWDGKLVINPAPLKSNTVDLSGANGFLDLSNSYFYNYYNAGTSNNVFMSDPTFSAREGSLKFKVLNDYQHWQSLYMTVAEYLHGKRMKIILEDDPEYYYVGRLTINEWASEPTWSKLVIDYYLDPFKYSVRSSAEPWMWDPFSFETGIIRYLGSITLDDDLTTATSVPVSKVHSYVIPGCRKPTVPKITLSNSAGLGVYVFFTKWPYFRPTSDTGSTFAIDTNFTNIRSNGVYTDIPGALITEGTNYLFMAGDGKITIDYRSGCL